MTLGAGNCEGEEKGVYVVRHYHCSSSPRLRFASPCLVCSVQSATELSYIFGVGDHPVFSPPLKVSPRDKEDS